MRSFEKTTHAASSPVVAPEGAAPPVSNKRLRPYLSPPSLQRCPILLHSTPTISTLSPPYRFLPWPFPIPCPLPFRMLWTLFPPLTRRSSAPTNSHLGKIDDPKPLSQPQPANCKWRWQPGHLLAKFVLDIFDGIFNDLRASLLGNEMLQLDNSSSSGSTGRDFLNRWQAQRFAEMDVLARQLRLVIKDSLSKVELN